MQRNVKCKVSAQAVATDGNTIGALCPIRREASEVSVPMPPTVVAEEMYAAALAKGVDADFSVMIKFVRECESTVALTWCYLDPGLPTGTARISRGDNSPLRQALLYTHIVVVQLQDPRIFHGSRPQNACMRQV